MNAGMRALVIGIGRSGLGATQVLRERALGVIVTDEKEPRMLGSAIAAAEAMGAKFVAPADLPDALRGLDFAVLSPGVPLAGRLAQSVLRADVPLLSEIEIAYQLCKAPMIAVTGTKGKSTTTALIGHLLRAAGKSVLVGGNIGNPLVREVTEARAGDWVVAEVSSFQLETVRTFKPRISVLLNISADHLDRYNSMDDYAQAKYRIFANQDAGDTFVGNLEDERVFALHRHAAAAPMHAKAQWFTTGPREELANAYLRGGEIYYAPRAGGPAERVLQRSEVPLLGEHNVQNALAAMLAALAAGLSLDDVRSGIKTFKAMHHRLQSVTEAAGVRYVDDSKATNPGAVIAALRAFEHPVILIAGGKSKGTDFREMGQVISSRAKSVILIGEAAAEIAATIKGPDVQRARSMDDAVARARAAARSGDVVLLSPGCASFDMFDSAEDRGEQFARAARSLREPAGA